MTLNFVDKIIFGAVATAVVLFSGDYCVARLREPNSLRTVEVRHFLAVPLKNGKYEFDYTGSERVPCVAAILPHFGRQPCWYLQRHQNQGEKI